jgi:predicted methyltransferase
MPASGTWTAIFYDQSSETGSTYALALKSCHDPAVAAGTRFDGCIGDHSHSNSLSFTPMRISSNRAADIVDECALTQAA